MPYDATYTPETNAALRGSLDVWDGCVEKYGESHQLMMLAEECAELSQAALKIRRCTGIEERRAAFDHLAEEMADVRIMLEQVSAMCGNDHAVAGHVNRKLERQRKRLRS